MNRSRPKKLIILGALVAALFALAVPSAGAATEWKACQAEYLMYDCASFEMPLDRTGLIPGTTTVRAVRQAALEGPRLGTMFVIAGGPGQASELMIGLVNLMLPGANRYDLIAVDQRGTGRSEPLNCPRLESGTYRWDGADPATDGPITDCSIAIGPTRAAYNTAEAVADLEAIRADLAIPAATLFGVSYGTKVALAYAKAHPSSTKALLLDSVLPTDMPDAFGLDSIAALRRSLTTICKGHRCKPMGDTGANLEKVIERLGKHPIESFLITPDFKVKKFKVTAAELYYLITSADVDPYVYNQLPSALKSALRGDTAAIERLYAIASGFLAVEEDFFAARKTAKRLRHSLPPLPTPAQRTGGRSVPGRALSDMLSIFSYTALQATICADLASPWPRSDVTVGRQAAIDVAANALDPAAIWPLPRSVVSATSTAAACRGWQQRPALPEINHGPLPDVPTLALSGALDMRTPTSRADRATVGAPRAQSIEIPNTGHSVIGMDMSTCASSLAKRFLLFGATDAKCRDTAPALPIAALPATSLKRVKQRRGSCARLSESRCRTERKRLTAGYLSIRDTFDQMILGATEYGVGLYGGSWEIDLDFSEESLDLPFLPMNLNLVEISNVPGVGVSGSLSLNNLPRISGKLTIGGRSVRISGRIDYDGARDDLKLRTRIRGKTVTVRIAPSKRGRSASVPTQKTLGLRQALSLAIGPPR